MILQFGVEKEHWSGFCRSEHFERSGVWKITFKKREKKVKKSVQNGSGVEKKRSGVEITGQEFFFF